MASLLSFNLGVEFGQLLALVGLLVCINAWRASGNFDRHASTFNMILMFAGFLLAAYQMTGYFFASA